MPDPTPNPNPLIPDNVHRWLVGLVQAVIMGVIGSIGLYVQSHPPVTPVVQTAPVQVQRPEITLQDVQSWLEKQKSETKK